MKTSFIDLHIHTVYSQGDNANLGIKETLDYYQTLGLRSNGRVVIRINDHNTIFGGVHAVEYFLAHRDDYPNLFVIPGIEFSVNLGHALKFEKPNYTPNPDYPNSDDKYSFVFKSAHIGAGPILENEESFNRWKNNPDLIVYSKLQTMFLDNTKNDGKYRFEDSTLPRSENEILILSNVGDQICACKNIIRKYYGVVIPYREYADCTKDGLDEDEIIHIFLEKTCSYLQKHYIPFKYMTLEQIFETINPLFTSSYTEIDHTKRLKKLKEYLIVLNDYFAQDSKHNFRQISLKFSPFMSLKAKIEYLINSANLGIFANDEYLQTLVKNTLKFDNHHIELGGKRKIHIDELCQIVKEAGGIIDFVHPNIGLKYHQKKIYSKHNKVIGVETAPIPVSLLDNIDLDVLRFEDKTKLMEELKQLRGGDIAIAELLKYDKTGLVAVQLIKNGLTSQGIKFNKGYVGVEIPKYAVEFAGTSLQKILNVMASQKFLPSVGFDKHLAYKDFYYQLLKDKEKLDEYKWMFNSPQEFEKYMNVLRQIHQHEPREAAHYDTYSDYVIKMDDNEFLQLPRVQQSAFCDALLGKEIDFQTSSLLRMHLGHLKTIEPEQELDENSALKDLKKEIIAVIYKDLHEFSAKYLQTDELKQFVSKLAENSRQEVVSLTIEDFQKDPNYQTGLGRMIINNRKSIMDAWKKGEFMSHTK